MAYDYNFFCDGEVASIKQTALSFQGLVEYFQKAVSIGGVSMKSAATLFPLFL